MTRRSHSGLVLQWLTGALSLLACMTIAPPARAIEVTCIEASRYKYIYRIFGNDRSRFAAYFGANARDLPGPEVCRAALVTGRIDPARRENADDNDFTRLMQIIRESDGWLATLYLASPGGNITMGLRLGELTRMFWLNATAIEDRSVEYVPDFLGAEGPGSPATRIPPDLENGWRDYVAATQSFVRVLPAESRARRCASACTYMAAAGIYRRGAAFFHRGRRGERSGREDEDPSMSDVLDRLQKGETRVIAFYRKMDAGDAAIQAFQSTASETVSSSQMPMMPRYVGDYLKKKCLTQGRRERPSSEDAPVAERSRGSSWKSRAFPESDADLQCVAASNTRERLAQYSKFCGSDCNQRELFHEATVRVRALLPDDKSSTDRNERRPRR